MSELLANLCGIPKVRGAALFTDAGLCVEYRLEPPYEQSFVQSVIKDLVVSMDSYAFLDKSPVSMAIAAATGGLLAFMVRNNMHVLALTDRDVNMAFLHVAFGALASKLDRVDVGSMTSISQSIPSLSGSNLTIEASQLERIPPVNAVPPEEIKRLLSAYTEFAGPAARLVVKDVLKTLGYSSSTLPREHLSSLIEGLATRLQTPQDREQFLRTVQKG